MGFPDTLNALIIAQRIAGRLEDELGNEESPSGGVHVYFVR